jgi:hypothetical protein
MRKRFFPICAVLLVLVVSIVALVTSCTPTGPTRCAIEVKATLDGSPWIGAVQYTLTGPGGSISGDTVPETFSNVDCGNWTCAYVSGGPGGAYLDSITPSPTQSVSEAGTIAFTLEFKTIPPARCIIEVKATLCGVDWTGNVSYTLTPGSGSPINGTNVSATFSVDCGNWTCAYVSGGPSGAYLESITPSATQTVSEGGNITFTLNFELNQDAAIHFLNWTISGQPFMGSQYEAVPCQIIDAHFLQRVDGCVGYSVTVNETSWLSITQVPSQLPAATIVVVNDDCAVNKTPASLQKVFQVPSVDNITRQKGYNITLTMGSPTTLDVETQWQLVKGTNYTKAINWFGISKAVQQGEQPVHPCVLFELVVPAVAGQYQFILQCSASVALPNDKDVNPGNDSTTSPPLMLTVNVV